QIATLGAEALARIKESPLTNQQRFLLAECVEAYLPLDADQQKEFEKLVATEKYAGVKAMNKTSYEKGIEAGIEAGIEKGEANGRRAVLRELLEARFGELSSAAQERLQMLSLDELNQMGKAILTAKSLVDLGLGK